MLAYGHIYKSELKRMLSVGYGAVSLNFIVHHINLSGNESKINVRVYTTKYKCMGMRGNNSQRSELRVENNIMKKINPVYLDICLQNTKGIWGTTYK
jgi:hypothetical protein